MTIETETVTVYGLSLDQLEHRLFAYWVGNRSTILGMTARRVCFTYPPDEPRAEEVDVFAAEIRLIREFEINRLYEVRQLPHVDYDRNDDAVAEILFSNRASNEIQVHIRCLDGDDVVVRRLKSWVDELCQEFALPPEVEPQQKPKLPPRSAGRRHDPWNQKAIERLLDGENEAVVRADWREDFKKGHKKRIYPEETAEGERKTWYERVIKHVRTK